jgi:hypothetical protein
MGIFNLTAALLLILIVTQLASSSTFDILFPDDLLVKEGSKNGVLDVKRLFGAKGDGIHDDTDALIRAMDYVMQSKKAEDNNSNHGNSTNIIYLPAGTYLVSRTVIHSTHQKQRLYSIRFQGQHRDKTIIKLKDNAFGNRELPVISFGTETSNNLVGSNFFEDITIDIGRGNPGATGLRFAGANNAALRNLRIKSSDTRQTGQIGIDISVGSTHGYYRNIEVTGFDYAFRLVPIHQTHISMEKIELKGQRKAGIWVIDSGVSARLVHSRNRVPALLMTGRAGYALIIDSLLEGGDKEHSAIELERGVLYAGNIRTKGYPSSIKKQGNLVTQSYVKEYISETAYSLYTQKQPPNLPVEDSPEVSLHQFKSKDRVNVTIFGAIPDDSVDDTTAIQRAINSGKPAIYFSPGRYVVSDSIRVPSSVHLINFMFSDFEPHEPLKSDGNRGAFVIEGKRADKPLLLEDLRIWIYPNIKSYWFLHHSTRTVIMKDLHAQRGSMYRNTVPGAKLFLENVSNVDSMVMRMSDPDKTPGNCFTFRGQKVWARWINPERAEPQVLSLGSDLWVLGFKTEYEGPQFLLKQGSRTEILGGVMNISAGTVDDSIQAVINEDSSLRATFYTTNLRPSEAGKYFTNVILDRQLDLFKYLRWELLPKRTGNQVFVPLYLSTP